MSEVLLYLYAETPVHAGADTSAGVIDNPIQREISTGFPVIWGQSLKGALRERAEVVLNNPDLVTQLFGAPPGTSSSSRQGRGHLAVGDAQLVAFPVPTVVNTFAWITSPLTLGRLRRKYARIGSNAAPETAEDRTAPKGARWHKDNEIFGASTTSISVDDDLASQWAKLLAREALPDDDVFKVFRHKLERDLAILDETDFTDNVRHGTEVTPRIALDDYKQVENLFYAEYLPTETILAATLTLRESEEHYKDDYEALIQLCNSEVPLQVGGDETIGKGLVWLRLIEGSNDASSRSTAS